MHSLHMIQALHFFSGMLTLSLVVGVPFAIAAKVVASRVSVLRSAEAMREQAFLAANMAQFRRSMV